MTRKLLINIALLLVTIWIALNVGATKLHNVIAIALGNGDPTESVIFTEIRAPRVVAAIAVGAALGIAGTLAQAVTRNTLAEPGILGTTSGAALFALVAIYFNVADIGSITLAVIATLGAISATALLYLLARNSLNGLSLVIMGIAISSTLGGLVGIVATIIKDPNSKGVTFWSLGTLSLTTQQNASLIAFSTITTALLAITYGRRLDYLALGDLRARHLGVSPGKVRVISLSLMALIVGFVTSNFGAITFIALATPHIARAIYGVMHRQLLIGSTVVGATLLLAADTIARTVSAPSELPISLVTALIGAPILAISLYRKTHAR